MIELTYAGFGVFFAAILPLAANLDESSAFTGAAVFGFMSALAWAWSALGRTTRWNNGANLFAAIFAATTIGCATAVPSTCKSIGLGSLCASAR